MRSFRQLSRDKVHELIAMHLSGDYQQVDIARHFNVDHSTVKYHVTKYERSYPEDDGIYAILKAKARRACLHPSGRCTICGEMWDELRRSELATIEKLQGQLATAIRKLERAGLGGE